MNNIANEGTPQPHNWMVYRQDDNGNIFIVQRGLAEDDARQLAADLESHGHKQLYWVTQEDPPSADENAEK